MKHTTIIKIIQIEFIQMIKVAIEKLLIQLISKCRYRLVSTREREREREEKEGGGGEVRYLYDLLGCVKGVFYLLASFLILFFENKL